MEFIVKDIILLGLDFRDDIIQESSIVMTIVNTVVIADNIADIVNNNYTVNNSDFYTFLRLCYKKYCSFIFLNNLNST